MRVCISGSRSGRPSTGPQRTANLAGLLTHADARVRLAAVEALQELRSPTGSGALETVLEDADRDVRVAFEGGDEVQLVPAGDAPA